MHLSVTGPLGLWSFPILNMLLEILGTYKAATASPRGTSLRATAENLEKWKLIRDATGRLKEIEVHREVKEA